MPPKKPASRRQNRSTRDVGVVVALPARVGAAVVPPADLSWPEEVQQSWVEFWSSPLADPRLLKPTDVPALKRLFDLRARLARAAGEFDAEPTVSGSMGQPTLSPWAAEMHRLTATIEKLEDRFGLSPLARLRLGVTFEEGVSLSARNAQILAKLAQQD
jgi:hypothetical protein